MSTRCFLMDIDGTVANGEHRLHHILSTPKDWDNYFAACDKDAPIDHMRYLVRALMSNLAVVYVSGRTESTRMATARWLRQHGFHPPYLPLHLYMRPDGDHRNDDVLKIELLAKIRGDGFDPVMAFDDRNRVVKAWRAAGVPCAQVAEGDF